MDWAGKAGASALCGASTKHGCVVSHVYDEEDELLVVVLMYIYDGSSSLLKMACELIPSLHLPFACLLPKKATPAACNIFYTILSSFQILSIVVLGRSGGRWQQAAGGQAKGFLWLAAAAARQQQRGQIKENERRRERRPTLSFCWYIFCCMPAVHVCGDICGDALFTFAALVGILLYFVCGM